MSVLISNLNKYNCNNCQLLIDHGHINKLVQHFCSDALYWTMLWLEKTNL